MQLQDGLVVKPLIEYQISDMEFWGTEWISKVLKHLDASTIEELSSIYHDENEFWGTDELEGFIDGEEFDNASTDNFSIGYVNFGTWNGIPCLADQNASPLQFLVKTSAYNEILTKE